MRWNTLLFIAATLVLMGTGAYLVLNRDPLWGLAMIVIALYLLDREIR